MNKKDIQAKSESTQESTESEPSESISQKFRKPRWLYCLFIIVVITIIWTATYFRVINNEWLNRVGIMLNLLAGFMMAPELIGTKRLTIFEKSFKIRYLKFTVAFYKKLDSFSGNSTSMFYQRLDETMEIAETLQQLGKEYQRKPNFRTLPKNYALLFRGLNNLVGAWVFRHIIHSFIKVAARLSDLFMALAEQLINNAELRAILITWGIIFFIVGNLLQFISTF